MTCLCKRRFCNPIQRKDRNPFDKYTIQAGCGTCSGCNKRKQNDWLVRAYFEYMSKPTTAFFVSLDFDEQHIPQYHGMNCFDSELMSSFFETLRQVLPPFRYLYNTQHQTKDCHEQNAFLIHQYVVHISNIFEWHQRK